MTKTLLCTLFLAASFSLHGIANHKAYHTKSEKPLPLEEHPSPYKHTEEQKHVPLKKVVHEKDEEFEPWEKSDPCIYCEDEGYYWYPCTDYCESECIENLAFAQLNPCCMRYVWFPEAPPLFLPFKADPRELTASVGYRFNDQVVEKYVIDVSYFDQIPVIRWFNLLFCSDQLELDLEGALWAIFQPHFESAPLVNADYYIGASLNYAIGNLSFRLRFFHISSHLGDEFLLNNPGFDRRNPSAEYLDLFASYYLTEDLRFYLGGGYIPTSDPSFPFDPWFGEGGAEVYLPWFRFVSYCHMLEGRPYYAMHFRLWQDRNWDVDQTYVLGYEFGKLTGLERKFRIFLEYHDGFSVEGQFCREKTTYFSIRMSYGF